MRDSMRKTPRTSARQTRYGAITALFIAALLAACAQGNSSADLAPAAQPATASAAPAPKGALTPEEAKTQCWMKYEGDKKVKNIDQRLILVEKCVDDTLRGQLVQGPQR